MKGCQLISISFFVLLFAVAALPTDVSMLKMIHLCFHNIFFCQADLRDDLNDFFFKCRMIVFTHCT